MNAFTVDFEDWYQGIGIPYEQWNKYEKRIHIGHEKLLKLFSKYKIKATYFLLGKTIEDHPKLIQEIIDQGHEIGCHTFTHPFLYEISKGQFQKELDLCFSAIKEFGIRYVGFRAPYFSIDHRSLWVLDVLENYFKYDASIYPGDNLRTGIPGFNPKIAPLEGKKLIEVPVSVMRILKWQAAFGGAYFRILPSCYFHYKFKSFSEEQPAIFYIHPWELDPNHPKLSSLHRRIRIPHYYNLSTTEKKLEKLLERFPFQELSKTVENTK